MSKKLRADYWISQNRKYCDFCKCWITDNKPSVDFHEKGRRHQGNVKKRLKLITKQSATTQQESNNLDATLRQIESAALQAYRKDVEKNADLTSMAINKKLTEENLVLSSGSSVNACASTKKLWQEAKSKDGKSYYCNIMTNEKISKPPSEGYLSLGEQREQANFEAMKQMKEVEKLKRKEALMRMQEIKIDETEERARLAREKLKERRVVDDAPAPVYAPLIEPGKTNPYGKWQTVKESETIDLQLPQQEYLDIPVDYEPEPIQKEFKEKTLESLMDGGGNVSFKKRKIGAGTKRNIRKRLDDD